MMSYKNIVYDIEYDIVYRYRVQLDDIVIDIIYDIVYDFKTLIPIFFAGGWQPEKEPRKARH